MMQKRTTGPLSRKITKKQRDKHTVERATVKGETNSRKERSFGYLFNILEQMGVFPTERAPDYKPKYKYNPKTASRQKERTVPISAKLVVAMHLYEGDNLDFSYATNEDLIAARKIYRDGIGRLDDLRRGDASFLDIEAEYFHEAFRLAFGDVWADKIDPLELVTGDVRNLISQFIEESVPVDWNLKDQLDILRLLIGSKPDSVIHAIIQPFADIRLSDAGNDLPEFEHFDDDCTRLSPEQKYQVAVLDVPPEEQFKPENLLVLEYSIRPIAVKGSNKRLRGQIHKNIIQIDASHFVIKKSPEKPLTANKQAGRYGFIALYHSFSSSEELFDCDEIQSILYEEDFESVINHLIQIIKNDSEIHVIDLPYQVL